MDSSECASCPNRALANIVLELVKNKKDGSRLQSAAEKDTGRVISNAHDT